MLTKFGGLLGTSLVFHKSFAAALTVPISVQDLVQRLPMLPSRAPVDVSGKRPRFGTSVGNGSVLTIKLFANRKVDIEFKQIYLT